MGVCETIWRLFRINLVVFCEDFDGKTIRRVNNKSKKYIYYRERLRRHHRPLPPGFRYDPSGKTTRSDARRGGAPEGLQTPSGGSGAALGGVWGALWGVLGRFWGDLKAI